MSNYSPTSLESAQRHENYLTANLLDFFRNIDNENKWIEAAKIALNQIERAANVPAQSLEKRFIFFSSRLKNNISPVSIRAFAQQCVLIAHEKELLKEPQKNEISSKNLERKLQKNLSSAINSGCSHASAINRAANNLFQEKLEQQRAQTRAKMIELHPLGATLSLLAGEQRIAKEDIRNHLLKLNKSVKNKGSTPLFNVLKKAQSFSVVNLHNLLGDELFFLCRPLGFLDQKDETVVVEVPSNAHMHALAYRKLEILRALKNDPCFVKLKSIRFKISGALF